ncbi:hypothetical protein LAU_0416 [Lausannevirus]|uniref:Uncharacterized protein n=2 Tax=Lausannevirus TaxID=999883 RepID=A0A0N9PUS7_9VIRU|nr:hypothetical protein LAU_0416 [Lausannevirus]AEA07266.1 hypothetical protein LAU_0416 [Lausannevirus]ALH07073.1 hypothetical protein PMV_375 [Port-miou virus]
MECAHEKEKIELCCHTCQFFSEDEEAFREHCENAHFSKDEYSADVECTACGFKTGRLAPFFQHLDKKKHKACVFYLSRKNDVLGNKEIALGMTCDAFKPKVIRKMMTVLAVKGEV